MKIVYYLNQFFGRIGGEEEASVGITVKEGPFGVSQGFQEACGDDAQIAATIICGDNHIAENLEQVTNEIVEIVGGYQPDAFVAGPAYSAGRYGVACGALCTAVSKKLNIPVLTAMNEINPGVQLYRKNIYIVKTGTNASTMRKDLKAMAAFLKKLCAGEPIGTPDSEGYYAKGYKRNTHTAKHPPERAVDMLLDKYYGRPFVSEIPLPYKEEWEKPAPVRDLSKATVMLATDGGLYPKDNPDNMPYANADRCGAYDISNYNTLDEGEWIIRHTGYDNSFSNADPNRLVPVDAMRTLEKEGFIGKLHNVYLATTGLIATVENSTKTAKQMVDYVRNHNIDAVILTST